MIDKYKSDWKLISVMALLFVMILSGCGKYPSIITDMSGEDEGIISDLPVLDYEVEHNDEIIEEDEYVGTVAGEGDYADRRDIYNWYLTNNTPQCKFVALYRDLTHDGHVNLILLTYDSLECYRISVYDFKDGLPDENNICKIYEDSNFSFHTDGCEEVYFCEKSGECYLAVYHSFVWQGLGGESYEVFFLTQADDSKEDNYSANKIIVAENRCNTPDVSDKSQEYTDRIADEYQKKFDELAKEFRENYSNSGNLLYCDFPGGFYEGENEFVSMRVYKAPLDNMHINASFPSYSGGTYHNGVDLSADIGTPCYAVTSGTVTMASVELRADKTMGLGGNCIRIDGDDGYVYYYAHLDGFECKVGDYVYAGQEIAKTGNTSSATLSAHLHLSIVIPRDSDMVIPEDNPGKEEYFGIGYATAINPVEFLQQRGIDNWQ